MAAVTKGLLGSTKIIEKTLSSSTSFFASLILVIVFTFLFLLYRGSFKEFIIMHFRDKKKEEAARVVSKIQKVSQSYFFGLILVVLILGTLNGTGLLDHRPRLSLPFWLFCRSPGGNSLYRDLHRRTSCPHCTP